MKVLVLTNLIHDITKISSFIVQNLLGDKNEVIVMITFDLPRGVTDDDLLEAHDRIKNKAENFVKKISNQVDPSIKVFPIIRMGRLDNFLKSYLKHNECSLILVGGQNLELSNKISTIIKQSNIKMIDIENAEALTALS